MPIIDVRGLTKIFSNSVKAVDGVSFYVEEGEAFGFLGPNGAGKTTTVKILATLLKPTSGVAYVAGYDVVKNPNEVRRSIGVVFQNPALDNQLTGRENLDYHARMYGLNKNDRERRIEEVLELVGLSEWGDVLVKNYSGGMRRRLEIARGLMHMPRVLFLDEPTLGLDAQTRRAIWDYIKKLNREGVTIFLTTHYMEEADYLCDRVAIIDHGRLLIVDEPDKLKNLIGRDVIYIECSDARGLVKALERESWVEKVSVKGHTIMLGVKEGEKKIPKLVEIAKEASMEITSINVKKPTLEDVFIYFTGRRIKDVEEGLETGRRFRRWVP